MLITLCLPEKVEMSFYWSRKHLVNLEVQSWSGGKKNIFSYEENIKWILSFSFFWFFNFSLYFYVLLGFFTRRSNDRFLSTTPFRLLICIISEAFFKKYKMRTEERVYWRKGKKDEKSSGAKSLKSNILGVNCYLK